MNRHTVSVACLMTIMVTATAWGQSSGSSTTAIPASSGTATAATGSLGTAAGQLDIKKQLRSEMAQLVVDLIQNLFSDMRTSLGLPAVPTDPTTDPISILESAVTNMVDTVLSR
jgi:hypothetical protein